MTIKALFDYVDEIKPNAFSDATKTVWLNEVEGMVQTEAFLWHDSECFQYRYAAQVSAAISFPDDHTMGFSDLTVLKYFRPGGKLTFTPGSPYAGNAKTNIAIQGVGANGLLFAENSFSATGTTEVTTPLTYDGSGVELLVEPPHSKLYAEYIMARIDYANGEYDKYDNTMQMFNAFWGEFMRWFARVYAPADRHPLPPRWEAPYEL